MVKKNLEDSLKKETSKSNIQALMINTEKVYYGLTGQTYNPSGNLLGRKNKRIRREEAIYIYE